MDSQTLFFQIFEYINQPVNKISPKNSIIININEIIFNAPVIQFILPFILLLSFNIESVSSIISFFVIFYYPYFQTLIFQSVL